MKMLYKAKGQRIVFDDFVDDVHENNVFFVGICTDCLVKYKELLGHKRTSIAAVGTCYVDKCENEADLYIDFDPDKIAISDDDSYTVVPKRQISITDSEENANLIDDLQVEEDHINATYELWFDVDKYFGEKTREDDRKWINFYTNWYPDGTMKAVYYVESDNSSKEVSWKLTEEEKQYFFWKMEEYCQKLYYKSLRELFKEVNA